MSYYVYIPKMNRIKLMPVGQFTTNKFQNQSQDVEFLSNRIQSWQAPTCYAQKVQYDNTTTIQVKSEGDDAALSILDYTGAVVGTVSPMFNAQVNDEEIPGGGTDLITTQWIFNLYDKTAATGIFYIKINFGSGTDEDINIISEPIDLQMTHEGTVNIRYIDNYNRLVEGDTWFITEEENWQTPVFELRVPGMLSPFKPLSSDNGYEDQTQQYTQLWSEPYRSCQLIVASSDSISDYEMDILNKALSCDTVIIDNKRYSKGEGAKFDEPFGESYPLGASRIELREMEQNLVGTVTTPVLIYPRTAAAYVIDELVMDGVTLAELRYIPNGDSEAIAVQDFNVLCAANGWFGSFIATETGIYYVPGYGEDAPTVTTAIVDQYFLQLTAAGGTDFQYDTLTTRHVIQWDDTHLGHVTDDGTVSHTYSVDPGVVAIRIWHNGEGITGLTFSAASEMQVTALAGQVTSDLVSLSLDSQDLSAHTFQTKILQPAVGSLTTISVTNCDLPHVNTSVFTTAGWDNQLINVDFSLNKLSSTDVDNLLIGIAHTAVYDSGGDFTTQFQAPAAPRTVASNGAYATLDGAGWGIVTD